MNQWTRKLEWQSYNMTELDSYAEWTFDNGIYIRVSTGDMAISSNIKPYELHIDHPLKGTTKIPKLSKQMLYSVLDDLENEIIEHF